MPLGTWTNTLYSTTRLHDAVHRESLTLKLYWTCRFISATILLCHVIKYRQKNCHLKEQTLCTKITKQAAYIPILKLLVSSAYIVNCVSLYQQYVIVYKLSAPIPYSYIFVWNRESSSQPTSEIPYSIINSNMKGVREQAVNNSWRYKRFSCLFFLFLLFQMYISRCFGTRTHKGLRYQIRATNRRGKDT